MMYLAIVAHFRETLPVVTNGYGYLSFLRKIGVFHTDF